MPSIMTNERRHCEKNPNLTVINGEKLLMIFSGRGDAVNFNRRSCDYGCLYGRKKQGRVQRLVDKSSITQLRNSTSSKQHFSLLCLLDTFLPLPHSYIGSLQANCRWYRLFIVSSDQELFFLRVIERICIFLLKVKTLREE